MDHHCVFFNYWQAKVPIQSFKRLLKNTAVTTNCDSMLSFRSFVCSYPRCTYVCCRGRSEVRPGGSMVEVGETYNGPTTSSEHRSLDDLHPTIPGSTQMFICDVLAALRYLCNSQRSDESHRKDNNQSKSAHFYIKLIFIVHYSYLTDQVSFKEVNEGSFV